MSDAPVYYRTDQKYTIHAAVVHPFRPLVLLLPAGEGRWRLPEFSRGKHLLANVEETNDAIGEMLGVDANTLYTAFIRNDPEAANTIHVLRVIEPQNSSWEPHAGAVWVDMEQLGNMALADEWTRAGIAEWLQEDVRDSPPEERAPWSRKGWYKQASAWINARLEERLIQAIGPPRQIKTWSISCLLRCPTNMGDVYFKAVPSIFSNEAGITQTLSEWFPRYVPAPIAVDPGRSWMLLPDFKGEDLREAGADESQWYEVLATMAEMQIACAGKEAELLAAGCQDRTIADLSQRFDLLLADSSYLDSLGSELHAALLGAAPRIKSMCREIGEYRVPHSLIHGDFHLGNVIFSEGRCTIFDWTDGAVSHPFFDLFTLFGSDFNKEKLGDPAPFYEHYLRFWTAYEPIERLHELLALTRVLGPLHHAISYRNIEHSLEPGARWEIGGAETFFLKKMISALPQE